MHHAKKNTLTDTKPFVMIIRLYRLRSWRTYQLGKRRERGRGRREICFGSLCGDVNYGNEEDPRQRTPEYSVYEEPNKKLENVSDEMITTHTCTMALFTTCQRFNTQRKRSLCSRERTTSKAAHYVIVNIYASSEAYRLTGICLRMQTSVQLLVLHW